MLGVMQWVCRCWDVYSTWAPPVASMLCVVNSRREAGDWLWQVFWHDISRLMLAYANLHTISCFSSRLDTNSRAKRVASGPFPSQTAIIVILVGGLEHFFPYIGNVIIPIDFHIFQRGGPTTNQYRVYPSWIPANKIREALRSELVIGWSGFNHRKWGGYEYSALIGWWLPFQGDIFWGF